MFSIPFYAILIAYFIYLLVFFIFSAANVYHIYSTGTFTFPAIIITGLTSMACVGILALTFLSLADTDWNVLMIFLGPNGLVTFQ